MKRMAACFLLTGATTLAAAQSVSGRVFATHDSDGFSERVASVGWTGAQGLGLRADTLALSEYLLVVSNLEPAGWSAAHVLELYRCRW